MSFKHFYNYSFVKSIKPSRPTIHSSNLLTPTGRLAKFNKKPRLKSQIIGK